MAAGAPLRYRQGSMDLRNKAVLVTGAGNRLGTAIALNLARAGAKVAVHDRSSEQVEGVLLALRRLGVDAAAMVGDLGAPADVDRMAAEVCARLGAVHGLVNNGAEWTATPIDGLQEDEWDRILAVNLKGPFLLAVHLGKSMAAAAGGVVVNIGDRVGARPPAPSLTDSVSREGIVALTQGLAKALAPTVRVHCVLPAVAQRSVAALARMVRFLMARDELYSGGIHVVGGRIRSVQMR